MISKTFLLAINDLAMSYKNKTIFLIVFIPVFVYFTLQLMDREVSEFKLINIGLIEKTSYSHEIIKSMDLSDIIFKVHYASDEEEGYNWLREKKVDGLLIGSENEENSLVLVVVEKGSLLTLSIVESFSALQRAAAGINTNWISDVRSLQEGGIQKQTLPTWILMLILLVSFILMPAQVAEEKEKKLLLALLQTPIRETEWLAAKLLSGMILILSAVLLLHLMDRSAPENIFSYIAFLVVGSFCFISFGILLGFLCRNQASARTLGVLFYLPHLLPSALSDFSEKLTYVAPLLPSYQLYEPIKSILLNDEDIFNLSFEWGYLLIVGLSALMLSYLLIKRRYLMS
jgi:ABC-2 type transport system permease protein